MSLESYIVRIYGREVDGVAGIVEDASSRRVKSFRSLAELLDLLRHAPRARGRNSTKSISKETSHESHSVRIYRRR